MPVWYRSPICGVINFFTAYGVLVKGFFWYSTRFSFGCSRINIRKLKRNDTRWPTIMKSFRKTLLFEKKSQSTQIVQFWSLHQAECQIIGRVILVGLEYFIDPVLCILPKSISRSCKSYILNSSKCHVLIDRAPKSQESHVMKQNRNNMRQYNIRSDFKKPDTLKNWPLVWFGWFGCVNPGLWYPVMGYPIFQGFFL